MRRSQYLMGNMVSCQRCGSHALQNSACQISIQPQHGHSSKWRCKMQPRFMPLWLFSHLYGQVPRGRARNRRRFTIKSNVCESLAVVSMNVSYHQRGLSAPSCCCGDLRYGLTNLVRLLSRTELNHSRTLQLPRLYTPI
jgi:hypothetical protein